MAKWFCAVALCSNSSFTKVEEGQKLSFHRFPVNKDIREKWITFCKSPVQINPTFAHICSEHFKPADFRRDLYAELMGCNPTRRLSPEAIPSINNPNHRDFLSANYSVSRLDLMDLYKVRKEYMDRLNSLNDPWVQPEIPSTSQQLPEIDKPEEIEEPNCSVPDVITPDYKLLYEELQRKNSFLQDKVGKQTAQLRRARLRAKRLIRHGQKEITSLTKKVEQLLMSMVMLKQNFALEKKKIKSQ